MNPMTQLSIRNIRCFADEHPVSLPRITLLVGENSTGKTTFLACCSALANLACNQELARYDPFNIPPFNMGRFDDIARLGCDSFRLAGQADGVAMSFDFAADKGTPYESCATVAPPQLPELRVQRDQLTGPWKVSGPSFVFDLDPNMISYQQFSQWFGTALRHQTLPYGGNIDNLKKRNISPDARIPDFVRLTNHLTKLSSCLPTADVAVRDLSPQIDLPRRVFQEHPLFPRGFDGTAFETTRERITRAGKKLQLFSHIDIRRTEHGGYELVVTIDGATLNIVDVGFGVHVALPILEIVGAHPEKFLMIQEPETHLHPMAQALLAQLVVETTGQYFIETHADHIINRLCICVRKGELDCRDVGILWFEKLGNTVAIHEISMDEEGNLLGAPANYRAFFERETEAFLGF